MVVVVRKSEWGTVGVVVVVMASWPGVSSTVVGKVRTRHQNRGLVGSWCKSSTWAGAKLLYMARSTLVHHPTLSVLIGLVDLSFHLDGRIH